MPIPTPPAAAGPYSTDGVTTTFAFAYKSFGVAYHAVVKDTSGVQEQLVYGVDFSVTQNADQENNPGGNVLISPALPTGSTLTIYSNVPYDQPLDLPLGGSFSSAGIRDALDRIVTLLKQSNLATTGGTLLPSDRSVRVPSGEAVADLPIAASRANKFLLFDSGGDVAVVNLGDLALLLTGGSLSGNLTVGGTLLSSSGVVGFTAGAGGAVTQLTSKATAVTLNKPCGQITTHNASISAGATVAFQLLSSAIVDSKDIVLVQRASGGTLDAYNFWCDTTGPGEARISVRNITGSPLAEALVLNFMVLRGTVS